MLSQNYNICATRQEICLLPIFPDDLVPPSDCEQEQEHYPMRVKLLLDRDGGGGVFCEIMWSWGERIMM